ncbi:hypothetical protein [Methylobacillus flagellatus]|uniref:Peptidase U35, phage prohead HK97 n=1 Tax=Methylobacillus flagellatus (strain ATCC 51484 / DSM 6875 / VKM B-1610 / KT) TaxID=265072 RepID=Q1GXS8_METFK|nr:hypothetical protein [Methylobacillus flagellatus]ABE50959.1 hypothetical protein Mfla_2696 [Methylobacillus flagellatus KT]
MAKFVIPPEGIRGEALREAAASDFATIRGLVYEALKQKLNPDGRDRAYFSIEAIYPDRVVVVNGDFGARKYSYPYSLDDSNVITLGEPSEVVATHTPVKTTAAPMREAVAATSDPEGTGRYLIRVVEAGVSMNDVLYPDAVLREAVPKFNNARVFVKSDDEHLAGKGKDVRNLVGRLVEAVFVPAANGMPGQIQAVLEVLQPGGDIDVRLREAVKRGMTDIFGFSIDCLGGSTKTTINGKSVRQAKSITKVDSVDLIVEPGAGGRLIRMTEAVNSKEQAEMSLKQRMLTTVLAHKPGKFAGVALDDINEDELETAYREAVAAGAQQNSDTVTAAEMAAFREELRMMEARNNARATIEASTLPQAAKDKLTAQFATMERFVEADVAKAISDEREYLSRFVESGKVSMPFDIQVEDSHLKMADMLDAFFDPEHKEHRSVRSFRECYIMITGDRDVTGLLRNCDRSRLMAAAGESFREAVGSDTFGNVLGDAITRRMQALFTAGTNLQAWRRVATTVPVSDFRTQERTRIGGYGNLPIVAERGAYNALTTPGDGKATYAVAKRGGTEDVSLEAIKNDDVGVLRRIPVELNLAAANTLSEFVFDFFRTNPVIHDTLALYHVDHGNLFTGALSAAQFTAHRLAMLKQTRAGSGKRNAVSPAILMVPFELQEQAYDLFVRGQNNDKTFVQTLNPEVIPVDYWTDGNDWVTLADPARLPVLEIGFLDGNEEPELFIQDSPTGGSMFSNDVLKYKIRHIYGGNILVDGEKGTTKAVVA